jgi:hypothetical protein
MKAHDTRRKKRPPNRAKELGIMECQNLAVPLEMSKLVAPPQSEIHG